MVNQKAKMIHEKTSENMKKLTSFRTSSILTFEGMDFETEEIQQIKISMETIHNRVKNVLLFKMVDPEGNQFTRITSFTDSFVRINQEKWNVSPTKADDIEQLKKPKTLERNFVDMQLSETESGYETKTTLTLEQELDLLSAFKPHFDDEMIDELIKMNKKNELVSKVTKDCFKEKESVSLTYRENGIGALTFKTEMNFLDFNQFDQIEITKDIVMSALMQ